MSEHALLSASSSERWILCPGSVALCKDIPSTSSAYAEYGTAGHELAAWVLQDKINLDSQYKVGGKASNGVVIDDEMVENVKKYVNLVREYAVDSTLMVEKRVDYSENIGVPDSFGTSDAIIVSADGKEITCIDLKMGKGFKVDAEDNSQLMLYAIGAINELSVVYPSIERVRMVIHQPRLDHISEWDCTIKHLMEFAEKARNSAVRAVQPPLRVTSTTLWPGRPPKIHIERVSDNLHPGEKQCRFCPAKSICPALTKTIATATGNDFDDLTDEPTPETLTLVEEWVKAKRAELERRLFNGEKLKHWKLVAGRQGKRNWTNGKEAEELLKSFRLKKEEMYDLSLISPTTAEKLFKEQPRRWNKVEELITRKDGLPSVAPISDKRPALLRTTAEQGFEELSDGN